MAGKRLSVGVLAGALALGAAWSADAAAGATNSGSRAAGRTTAASASEASAGAKTATSVNLSLPSPQVKVGDPVAANVSVLPAGRRDVQVQIRSTTHRWQTAISLRADATGAASGSWTPTTADDYQVRAVAPATKSQAEGVSARQAVTAKYGTTVPTDQLDPLVPGRLTIRKRALTSTRVGEFRVRVRTGGRGPELRISDGRGRVAWASDPGKAFVTASRNRITWIWRSTAGAFWPHVARSSRLTRQSISCVRHSGSRVIIKGSVRGGGDSAPYTLTLRQVRRSSSVNALDLGVEMAKARSGKAPNSVAVVSGRRSKAPVHGLGEQYRPFDLSGQVMPILVQEQGVTRGEQPAARIVDLATWGAGNLNTTYAPWPSYVTGQDRSFELVDNLRSGAFSIADMSRNRQVSLESFQSRMTARVLARGTPASLMAARAAGTSRQKLASWIQRGAVLGIQGGTQKVRNVVDEMRRAGTKLSGVWLQDWVGKRVTSFGEQLWWTWQLDRSTYPGWNRMVEDFKKEKINVLTYINPFVIDANEVNGHPITNFYKQGERKGYLVRNQRGRTYVIQTVGFPTALVDLTNPKARDWYANIIARNVIGVGASGFMADFGEYLPFDARLHSGTGLTQHNRYPQLWSQTVREGCRRSEAPDCVAFFRSGYLGTAKDAPLMWAGDQMVNYAAEDGMKSAVKGMLAGGVSGAPLWHSDIGGYTSVNTGVTDFVRPPQLNARWAEMEAFGVVMRTHETNRPPKNQQVYSTPQTRSQFARASRIYAALRDYRSGVVKEAVRKGIPAMRHPWLVYPGSLVAQQDLQFFLGAHLFVAPVYEENATSVDVTFPPGKWRHILTGKVYEGNRVTKVSAPIGTPAAFVKVGDPQGKQILQAMRKAGLRQ